MKTYILLKDLPFVKAGAEINSVERGLFSIKNDNGKGAYLFSKEQIETTPEWFKEVPYLDKPPLGLMPKYLHDEKRLHAIREAIGRYRNEGKIVPQEWIYEEEELIKKMPKEYKKNIFAVRVFNGGYNEGDDDYIIQLSNDDKIVITKERLAEIILLEKHKS